MTEMEAEKRAANTARRPRFSHNKQMAGQRGKKRGEGRDERNIKGARYKRSPQKDVAVGGITWAK